MSSLPSAPKYPHHYLYILPHPHRGHVQQQLSSRWLLQRSSRHSKTPRPSIERDESSQPDPKRRRSAGSRRAKTEETPSPAPHPIILDEILVAPARDAVRGTEASADDGIGEEIFGLSISPPLPWFAGMLSQYNKWVEQLPEVHRLEKYREETRSELERLHVDQFRHEKVEVAFEPEYLGYHVREYREAYLTSQTKLRKAERKREIFQERLNHLEEQIGFKGGPRCKVELLSLEPHVIAGWVPRGSVHYIAQPTVRPPLMMVISPTGSWRRRGAYGNGHGVICWKDNAVMQGRRQHRSCILR